MSRRDLIIYVLIALFTLGGGALISGLTVQPGTITPYLVWGGLSSVLVAGVGLCVMLFVSPPAPVSAGAHVARPPMSENAAILTLVGMIILGILALVALIGFFMHVNKAPRPDFAGALPPAVRGPVALAALHDQKFIAADPSRFVGQAESASGTIVTLNAERAGSAYTLTLTPPGIVPQVYLAFDDGTPYGYSPGDHIYARCRIERADPQALGLSGCQITSSQDWASGK